MIRLATDYLDQTARCCPDRIAFTDEVEEISFGQLQQNAVSIASRLISLGIFKEPVLVYMKKGVRVPAAFQGVSYSGNFYSPIDIDMPEERINKIAEQLQPKAIITEADLLEKAKGILPDVPVYIYEEMVKTKVERVDIEDTVSKIIDSDVLYVLFTSGSTGVPKGVIISHKGIVDLTEWISDALGFGEDTIFANQSPFYFSFSVYEIYQTLKQGAHTYIVPKKLFAQPTKLMQYLDDNKVNTLIWVPSILTFISALNALNRPHLSHLKNVFFGAETFQIKHLNRWMAEYPDVRFMNLFGPTEVTDTCTWYEIDRKFDEDDLLPIGKSCQNKDCFLLDEEDKLITKPEELGEICMRGSGVAYGYYNDPERTAEVFVQNPLQNRYREIIYRTGDLGRYNQDGDMVYVCRKDLQIKHRGRRIELGEIEAAAASVDGVNTVCCVYDQKKEKIVLFYTGKISSKDLNACLKDILPDYMVPGKRVQMEELPHNLNGKTDRKRLKELMEED